MNAVIYARFSDHTQREESIEGQLRVCEEYAKKHELTIIDTYERITIGIYDTSETQGAIVEEKKLGEQVAYILLPGGDGSIPKVSFTEMTPKVIYSSGTRHLYVTVKNPALLDNRGNWDLVAHSVDGKTSHTIAHEFISIKDGVMDVAIDDSVKLAPGSWYLQLEWTDAAVAAGVIQEEYQNQTASCLSFTVSEDVKYKRALSPDRATRWVSRPTAWWIRTTTARTTRWFTAKRC